MEVSRWVLLFVVVLSADDDGSVVGCGVSHDAATNKPIIPNVKSIFFIKIIFRFYQMIY
jgi:hypothetical protein